MDKLLHYDAVEALEAEVKRFKATNRFTPMEVTNFYVQAGLVLRSLEDECSKNQYLEHLVRELRGHLAKASNRVIDLEKALKRIKDNVNGTNDGIASETIAEIALESGEDKLCDHGGFHGYCPYCGKE